LHGPHAYEVLKRATGGSLPPLEPLHSAATTIAGHNVTVIRNDQCGVPGFRVIGPIAGVRAVWSALLESDATHPGLRPIGWHAFNIARIEAGTPLFNIDFGPTSLPHETGILHDRVSFTKGCYLGQEIVARMESLGQPKQMLVGLRMQEDALPVAGAQVFAAGAAEAQSSSSPSDGSTRLESPVGTVTSSALAPMLSSQPVAFASIRTAHAGLGARVLVNAEGRQAIAEVSPLSFLPAAHASQTSP